MRWVRPGSKRRRSDGVGKEAGSIVRGRQKMYKTITLVTVYCIMTESTLNYNASYIMDRVNHRSSKQPLVGHKTRLLHYDCRRRGWREPIWEVRLHLTRRLQLSSPLGELDVERSYCETSLMTKGGLSFVRGFTSHMTTGMDFPD